MPNVRRRRVTAEGSQIEMMETTVVWMYARLGGRVRRLPGRHVSEIAEQVGLDLGYRMDVGRRTPNGTIGHPLLRVSVQNAEPGAAADPAAR